QLESPRSAGTKKQVLTIICRKVIGDHVEQGPDLLAYSGRQPWQQVVNRDAAQHDLYRVHFAQLSEHSFELGQQDVVIAFEKGGRAIGKTRIGVEDDNRRGLLALVQPKLVDGPHEFHRSEWSH